MDDKPPLKGAWSGHVTPLKCLGPNHIFAIGEAIHFNFRVLIREEYVLVHA